MTSPIVVFDLDGTLIDSLPDIHAASARLLAAEGLAPLPLERIRAFIGHGVPALIDQIIAATPLDAADLDRLIAAFLADYNANSAHLTRLYPNVLQCLTRLNDLGFRLGVCTNKPLEPTQHILKAYGLSDLICGVVGGDSFPAKKPDPTGLKSLIERLGNGPALYIGDSAIDALTATRAAIPFGLFTEGYLNANPADVHSTFQFDAFGELASIVEDLLARPGAPA